MPASEIAYRSWQAASKWLERLSPPARAFDPERCLQSHAPAIASPAASLELIRERLPQRFFAGAADEATASRLVARVPSLRRDIVTAANSLLNGRFDLLGYSGLQFGEPIDWHLDPIWSKRAPCAHWSRIDPLDADVVGDSKVVWELNRHQWMVQLAQAWAITGETRYAAACVNAMESWLEANPVGVGINWTSSLEAAYRLISWCWTMALIRSAPAVSGERAMTLLTSIWQHANHVRHYLSYYSSPNTHLTGEALGLFYAGALFPEFREAAEWRRIASRVLIAESRSQLLPDGVHFEQSTCYQRYTVEIYLHFLLLALRNGTELPPSLTRQIGDMVEFMVTLRRPDSSMPVIGDDDGGALLPLVERPRGDCRGVFATAAAVFKRPHFAWAADGVSPEVFWLMGADGVKAFDTVPSMPPPDRGSRIFRSGGYAVMRSGWAQDAHQLIVDVGPLGCSTSSGHGHADLLSVQCSIFGEPCLVDAGTYCYTPEHEWRDFFRGTMAHSTVVLDGASQAEPAGPFRWHQRPRVRLRQWQSDVHSDLLDAEHDAYHRLADPVTCRRRVIFVKPEYWLIADDLDGASSHDIEVAFQFAPAMQVTPGPDGWIRAQTPGGHVLWMLSLSSSPLQADVKTGEREPVRGWVSADYGVRQPAPMLVYSSTATLPWRALTLLVPDRSGSTAPPVPHAVYDAQARPIGFDFDSSRSPIRI